MKTLQTERRLLRLTVLNSAVLSACYMPFLRHKGLFVPSPQHRELGEKIFLVLTLRQQNLIVAGMTSVCWITKKNSSDGREAGYGLHFDEDSGELRAAIDAGLEAGNRLREQFVSYTL